MKFKKNFLFSHRHSPRLLCHFLLEKLQRERDWCALTCSFVLSLPFLIMKWLAPHTEQPWFFLFCWPLDWWEDTSRALVQDCCSSSSDCCVKNPSAFSWTLGCLCLPAPFSEALLNISAHSSHKDNRMQVACLRLQYSGRTSYSRAETHTTCCDSNYSPLCKLWPIFWL